MALLDRDALYQYYIVEGHSREETAQYFDVSVGTLKNSLSAYSIYKDSNKQNVLEKYNDIKESVIKAYIENNETTDSILERFNLTKSTFIKLLRFWGIKKDRHSSALNSRKSYKDNFLAQMPSYGEVYQFYIVENHSRAECIEHWDTSRKVLGKWLSILGIKKVKPIPFVSKADFYKYYIEENHTHKECAEHFNISIAQVIYYTKTYNIHKSHELSGKHSIKNNTLRWASYSAAEKQEIAAKISNALLTKTEEEKEEIQSKINTTKRKNKTFSVSKPEQLFYNTLVTLFGKENIKTQYNKDPRYPFLCDFYIVPLDIFIELNFFVSHGTEPFDPTKEEHQQRIAFMQEQVDLGKTLYADVLDVWTRRDPYKVEFAKKHNLNYFAIYNNNQLDQLIIYLQNISEI